MSTAHGLMAAGLWHAYHGRSGEELAAVKRTAEMIKKSHCINSHMIVVMPMLAAACRQHADTVQAEDPDRSRQLRHRAAAGAVGVTDHATVPGRLPPVAARAGISLAANGKTRQALWAVDRSLDVAHRQQARYDARAIAAGPRPPRAADRPARCPRTGPVGGRSSGGHRATCPGGRRSAPGDAQSGTCFRVTGSGAIIDRGRGPAGDTRPLPLRPTGRSGRPRHYAT